MVDKPQNLPLFIVLEGIDGSGTTTQGDLLTSWLRNKGYDVFYTHEPSGGPAGMLIRLGLSGRLLGANFKYFDSSEQEEEENTSLDPGVLALLYAADRLDHLKTEILPNLRRGRIVICDRYILSTLAYQGIQLDTKWLRRINEFVIRPDLTFYLDVPVEHANHRMKKTRWTKDLYEDEGRQRLVLNRYRELINSENEDYGEIIKIDSSQSKKKVSDIIFKAINKLLPSQKKKFIEHTLFSSLETDKNES